MTSVLAKKFKLDVMKIAILVTSLCLSVMWFIRITPDCTIFEDRQPFCLQIFAMILLVFVIKFCNTVFVSGLIVYSQEVFPSPVRSLGYGFTTTFGRLGTIIVPFYIKYMRARYEAIIPLCFLAPIGYLCWYFCRHMPYTE